MKLSQEPSMKKCNIGRIHSVESFGTVDGPGIRYVVFFQGCPFRCLFCHNPDTWEASAGTEMTVAEILDGYERNRNYYKKGGITATGGEPLLQLDFLTELFVAAKEQGIHTCLDTAGAAFTPERAKDYERLLSATDLVLLDFKHSNAQEHKKLTGHLPTAPLAFATLLSDRKIPTIIRHVLVPGLTDSQEQLVGIGRQMRQFTNIVGLEVLPYHKMGIAKYEGLNLPYALTDTPALTAEDAKRAKAVIYEAFSKQTKD